MRPPLPSLTRANATGRSEVGVFLMCLPVMFWFFRVEEGGNCLGQETGLISWFSARGCFCSLASNAAWTPLSFALGGALRSQHRQHEHAEAYRDHRGVQGVDGTTQPQAVGLGTAIGGLQLAILQVIEDGTPRDQMVMGGTAAQFLLDRAPSCVTVERKEHELFLQKHVGLFEQYGPGEGPLAETLAAPSQHGRSSASGPSGLSQPPPPPGPPPPLDPPAPAAHYLPGNAPAHWALAGAGAHAYRSPPTIPVGWMVPLRPLEPLRPGQTSGPASGSPIGEQGAGATTGHTGG